MFRACQGLFVRIVAISSYTAQLAKDYGLRHVAVVTPSLPSSPLTSSTGATAELPPAFLSAKQRILQFGRLVPRKGALWFAQHVVPLLPQDAEFFVVGSSHGYSQLSDLEACERTHYLGPLPPDILAAMIRAADVVVMPNVPSPKGVLDVEGFGLVAVETSSLGGLLIASRFQGLKDAVLEGTTGGLASPGNPMEWKDAVYALLAEPIELKDNRRLQASKMTRAHFSRERMSDEFAGCFKPPGMEGSHDDVERLRSGKSFL
jgi:phosphatidylinositol alpha-1,6-mannosyltransferase